MNYLFDSPLGPLSYAWDGKTCSEIWLQDHPDNIGPNKDPVSQWFNDYFQGKCGPTPALAEPATPFQEKMRLGLLSIPMGEVRTYGELAKQLGTSPRALGQALGANPLPILIPCHRVIAADGLGGFSCGLEWKKKLLKFERGF